jgi:RNA polymerase sigma-70 factor (ECF subfamily)
MPAYLEHTATITGAGSLMDRAMERLIAGMGAAFDRVESKQDTCSPVQAMDEADIRASREGDPEAYRRLVERYQGQVSRIVWRFSRDRQVHEELVQDVFVEAYLSLGGFRGSAPFGHWLSRVATRVGYHYWKQASRHQKAEGLTPEEMEQWASAEADPLEAEDAAALVHKVLAQLPPRDRLVLTLRYLEECDVTETAERTGWTQTMVKVQTLRAKKKLEKLLRRYEKEALR